jgi:hypothetical protein
MHLSLLIVRERAPEPRRLLVSCVSPSPGIVLCPHSPLLAFPQLRCPPWAYHQAYYSLQDRAEDRQSQEDEDDDSDAHEQCGLAQQALG